MNNMSLCWLGNDGVDKGHCLVRMLTNIFVLGHMLSITIFQFKFKTKYHLFILGNRYASVKRHRKMTSPNLNYKLCFSEVSLYPGRIHICNKTHKHAGHLNDLIASAENPILQSPKARA